MPRFFEWALPKAGIALNLTTALLQSVTEFSSMNIAFEDENKERSLAGNISGGLCILTSITMEVILFYVVGSREKLAMLGRKIDDRIQGENRYHDIENQLDEVTDNHQNKKLLATAIGLGLIAVGDAICESIDAYQEISLLGTRAFSGYGSLFSKIGVAGAIIGGADSAITEVSAAVEVAKMAFGN